MGFFLQLQLLIWKNFILRKRQKIRCVVELIWPLFLFSILMWVRTRGLKLYVNECHFQEKAMPSAGHFPFLQSFLCSFNNTCHSTINASEYGTKNFNNSILAGLSQDLEEIMKNDTLIKNWQKVQSVGTDVQELTMLLKQIMKREKSVTGVVNISNLIAEPAVLKSYAKNEHINVSDNAFDAVYNANIAMENVSLGHLMLFGQDPKLLLCDKQFLQHALVTSSSKDLDLIVTTFCSLPTRNITSILNQLRKQTQFEDIRDEAFSFIEGNLGHTLQWEQWRQLNRLTIELVEQVQSLESYQAVARRAVTAGNDYRAIITALQESNVPMAYATLLLSRHFICGDSAEGIVKQIAEGVTIENTQQYDTLTELLKTINKEKGDDDYEYDSDASPECNDLFKMMEQSTLTRFLWLQLKPFFRGKILYAPNHSAGVHRVMERVNKTFETVQMAKEFSKYWSNVTFPAVREKFNNSANLKMLKEFVHSELGQTMLSSIVNTKLMSSVLTVDAKDRVEYVQQLADRLLQENNTAERAAALELFRKVQTNVTRLLDCFDVNKTEAFATEEDATSRAMKLLEQKKLWALVSFLDIDEYEGTNDTLPPFVSYKIRMDSDRVDSTNQVQDWLRRPGPRMRPALDLKYLTYGFAYLQDLIERSVIAEQTGQPNTPGLFLKQFPYPCHIVDRFVLAISRTFPLIMTLSWVYSCCMLIKSIVYEKERRLKETMRVMGLGNAVHWFGWFIDSIIPMLFTVIFLTLILVYGKVLERSDPTVVFLFLMAYCVVTITKGFLISVFFSKANLAAAAGGIIFFVMYLPYPFMVLWQKHSKTTSKVITSLFSNVAFGFGCSYFAMYEEMGVGIHWHNMDSSPIIGDHYSLKGAIIMMGVDAVIYSVLTWYIETVFPGQYGVPKPWYFPILKSYWFSSESHLMMLRRENVSFDNNVVSDNCEEEPANQAVGVSVKNLHKVYKNGKIAVHNLSINFFENHITSFLGHNGAGKTTTISILTGLFPPSSGTALIYGLDIRKDMDSIRRSLGMCPQHNVLFDQLSVEEHLWFYGRLKGHPAGEVSLEMEQMLQDLGLPDKRAALSRQLSGGMQRKLSIGAAFIGGSKTVILDEPTSGVDPFSRRSIWELLVKYKQGRTVIMTTHFMDEADLLGDRIAIIANGKLQCCGSSMFLKEKYSHGYYLTIETNAPVANPKFIRVEEDKRVENQNGTIGGHRRETISENCNHSAISAVVKSVIPSALVVQQLGTELVFNLPESQSKGNFEELFNVLDARMTLLGVISYGISDTTLEEIFLQVAEQGEVQGPNAVNGNVSVPENEVQGAISPKQRLKQLEKSCFPCRRFLRARSSKEEFTMKILDGQKSTKKQVVIQLQGSSVTYNNIPTAETSAELLNTIKIEPHTGNWIWQQFIALHIKRFHHTKRKPKAMFTELVVPAMFVCLTLACTLILPQLGMPPALVLEPWIYPPPNYVFFSDDTAPGGDSRAWEYQQALIGDIGMGTKCVVRKDISDPCVPVDVGNLSYPSEERSALPNCSCSVGTLQCPRSIKNLALPQATVTTGDIIINMTGSNVSEWIVKTTAEYESLRYGGFTFGVHNALRGFNMTRLLELMIRFDSLTGIGNMTQPILSEITADNMLHVISYFEKVPNAFDNIRVWYNNKGWTSSVSYMNAVNNIVLRTLLPDHLDKHKYGIQVINHPVNFSKTQMTYELTQRSGNNLLHAISVIFALSFVPASFVVFLIEERVSNAKHQQFVSGANRLVYWISTYCWDLSCYMVSALLCILVFLAFNEKAYVSESHFPGLVLLLILYGWSSIPLMYPASFVFTAPSTAFVTLACANLLVGIATTVATFVLEIFDDEDLQYIASIIRQVFLIFPHFCMGQGLMNMAKRHFTTEALAAYGVEVENNIFTWGFLGKNLACMLLEGVVFFLFTLLIEYRSILISQCCVKVPPPRPCEDEDDVGAERLRVLSGEADTNILVMKNLTKMYGRRSRRAVDQICVGVKRGECFGLLGLNGAGKTSTFKMLTGDIDPTSGDASVMGLSVRREMDKVRMHLGYCPQFDALDPFLTPREHLELYSRLRGISDTTRHLAVNAGMEQLGLTKYANRCSGTLSGGNKRKLSTAIALVGSPPLVFLDEPTSGMDPKARRFLWSCILKMVAAGRSVVLTSHSMEECEALCTKLTIMVNGQFTCFGSSQHLKSKYGSGYTLQIRCKPDSVSAVSDFISSQLPRARLKESHYNQLRYQLPLEAFKLAHVFHVMEIARNNSGLVQDYSISQTTLEEVFLRFADKQIADSTEEAVVYDQFVNA